MQNEVLCEALGAEAHAAEPEKLRRFRKPRLALPVGLEGAENDAGPQGEAQGEHELERVHRLGDFRVDMCLQETMTASS